MVSYRCPRTGDNLKRVTIYEVVSRKCLGDGVCESVGSPIDHREFLATGQREVAHHCQSLMCWHPCQGLHKSLQVPIKSRGYHVPDSG